MDLTINRVIFFITCCTSALFTYFYSDYTSWKTNEQSLHPNYTPPISLSELVNEGSSVWCQGQNATDRQCHFTNLCYIPQHKQFVFLHSSKSEFHNFPQSRHHPALLDLSSVRNHNQHYFDFVDIQSRDIKHFNPEIVSRVTLVFNRFLPSNLMHALHDDVLPALFTMSHISYYHSISTASIRLLFMDDNPPQSQFDSLYKILTNRRMSKSDIITQNKTLCFMNVHVGLSKQTLWYQYGFSEPQGPLNNAFSRPPHFFQNFRSKMIKEFRNKSRAAGLSKGQYMVLLSRSQNRLIVNENSLIDKLSKTIKIVRMSLDNQNIEELVSVVGKSAGILGMHGSLLAVALFLPPKSVLIEMFPYGISPEDYRPYKTLSELPGVDLIYRAWRNVDPKRSVTHPDWEPEFGGIHHLPLSQQNKILSSDKVGKHLCCSDPEWLFRIYQDTEVDVDQVEQLMLDALNESDSTKTPELLPSQVLDIKCDKDMIYWSRPWNLPFIKVSHDKIKFEIRIQEPDSQNYSSFFTESTSLKVEDYVRDMEYNVWIRCYINERVGPFNGHKSCQFNPA